MESASSQASSAARRHYVAAITSSLALSIAFWLFLDVFQFAGFVLWTCVAALLGSSIGLVAGKKLYITILATALIRIVIFLIMTLFIG